MSERYDWRPDTLANGERRAQGHTGPFPADAPISARIAALERARRELLAAVADVEPLSEAWQSQVRDLLDLVADREAGAGEIALAREALEMLIGRPDGPRAKVQAHCDRMDGLKARHAARNVPVK